MTPQRAHQANVIELVDILGSQRTDSALVALDVEFVRALLMFWLFAERRHQLALRCGPQLGLIWDAFLFVDSEDRLTIEVLERRRVQLREAQAHCSAARQCAMDLTDRSA